MGCCGLSHSFYGDDKGNVPGLFFTGTDVLSLCLCLMWHLLYFSNSHVICWSIMYPYLFSPLVWVLGLPIKFLLEEGSRSCVQPVGQAIKTVLCFIPPSPADWMSREKPSRRLDVTTTWEKPFVRSAAMAAFRFCRTHQPMGGKQSGQWGCQWGQNVPKRTPDEPSLPLDESASFI